MEDSLTPNEKSLVRRMKITPDLLTLGELKVDESIFILESYLRFVEEWKRGEPNANLKMFDKFTIRVCFSLTFFFFYSNKHSYLLNDIYLFFFK